MSESKSDALPLGYGAIRMVEGHGFEPWNHKEIDLQSTAFDHFAIPPHKNKNGADRGNRTPNLLITSQLRYQLRYVGKIHVGQKNKMVGDIGLEPMTLCL